MAENKMIYGKRLGNKSIKIYETEQGYRGVIKFYLLGFCYRKKSFVCSKYSEVEDYILEFKNQPERIH
ncbi:hypothetical protein ASZ90_003217 [hydrocarbon metagenome]|uniref:Uncharacterized protein n=1 Tax=hydrocarbon metagenome TaxID=938273 RepID=A0A0W8G187_9ZZZZ